LGAMTVRYSTTMEDTATNDEDRVSQIEGSVTSVILRVLRGDVFRIAAPRLRERADGDKADLRQS